MSARRVHPVRAFAPPGWLRRRYVPTHPITSDAGLRWLQRGFLVLGLFLLASWSTTYLRSRGFQAAAEHLEALRAETYGPLRNAAFVGPLFDATQRRVLERVLGTIEISRLRIAAPVAEGTDSRTLGLAVGHIPSTALPGTPGNCALAGHRDTFLRGLKDVRLNDEIRILTPQGTYTYQVTWTAVVEPRRVDVLDSTSTRSLTLVTCYPFEFIGHAPRRFIVRAREILPAASSATIPNRGAHPYTHGRSATHGGSDK